LGSDTRWAWRASAVDGVGETGVRDTGVTASGGATSTSGVPSRTQNRAGAA